VPESHSPPPNLAAERSASRDASIAPDAERSTENDVSTLRERRRRTVVKTVLYRLLMLLITVGVALLFTGAVDQALQIGLAANAVKTGTYYGYDRLWSRIAWGIVDDA